MIRHVATTAAGFSILLALHRDCLAQERVVSLSVQPEIQTNRRVIVRGKTNLPPDTFLMISVQDELRWEPPCQTKAKVLSDGTYESELLGPLSGLKDGQYLASVTMPYARYQPEAVRRVIGDSGQNLKGPLADKGTFGNTVNAEKKFSVGGEDAAETQTARLKNDLEQYGDLTTQIKELFSRLKKTKSKRLLDDQNNLADFREWRAFARQFRSDLEAFQKCVDNIESLEARLYLAVPLGDVRSMFHDVAFAKEEEYRQSKSAYVDSLKELEDFIRERESRVPAQTPSHRPRRREAPVAPPRIPADVTYSIVSSHVVPGIKRSLDVRLNKKVSKETLHALALELKSQDSRTYERTFIAYYLPDMKVDAGAWATTHFNTGLEVRILRITLEQEQALKQQPNDPSREIIGSWLQERGFANRITIFRKDGKLFMENKYTDGSAGTAELVETSSPRGRRFDYNPDRGNGEYYLINSKGDLQQWDQDGPFLTARKIK